MATTARSSRAATAFFTHGNAPFDPQHEFVNKNLLHTAQSIADLAKGANTSPIDVAESLLRARQVLFDARELRPRPQLDDKVLTAWNGLMIAAFARASRVLGGGALGQDNVENPTAAHLQSATAAASFIRDTMWNADTRTLLRRYRAGSAAIDGYAEDYACLIFGVLELFQASGDPAWLAWARDLQARQDELFWDSESGGWFSTTGSDPSVLVRMKEDYDGAEPAPTSVSAMNLLTLAHLTGERAYSDRAMEAIASFGGRLEEMGRAVPFMAAALSRSIAQSEQIVILGPRDAEATEALWIAAHKKYRPFAVVTRIDPKDQAALSAHMPWVAGMKMIDGKPTVYVCRDFACDAPSTDPACCPVLRRMSATIEVISTRNGAWRRIVLGGGRGNLLSLELIRELGRAVHALESERGIKWLTIEGSGGEFSYGARIQEHTPELMATVLPETHRIIKRLLAFPACTAAPRRGPLSWWRIRAGPRMRRHHCDRRGDIRPAGDPARGVSAGGGRVAADAGRRVPCRPRDRHRPDARRPVLARRRPAVDGRVPSQPARGRRFMV